jgi:hypothetical protein
MTIFTRYAISHTPRAISDTVSVPCYIGWPPFHSKNTTHANIIRVKSMTLRYDRSIRDLWGPLYWSNSCKAVYYISWYFWICVESHKTGLLHSCRKQSDNLIQATKPPCHISGVTIHTFRGLLIGASLSKLGEPCYEGTLDYRVVTQVRWGKRKSSYSQCITLHYFVCESWPNNFISCWIESNAFRLPWNGIVQHVVNKGDDRLYIPHQQGMWSATWNGDLVQYFSAS